MKGYPINWAFEPASGFKFHPLYIKYNNQTFGTIDRTQVQASLAGVTATAGSDAICAYLSWLIRTSVLLEA